MKGASDEELLAAIAAGPGAFPEFYRRHVARVTGMGVRRFDSPEDVADFVANVFLEVLGSADRFDPRRGTAVAWLYGVAGNVAAGMYRRQARTAKPSGSWPGAPTWRPMTMPASRNASTRRPAPPHLPSTSAPAGAGPALARTDRGGRPEHRRGRPGAVDQPGGGRVRLSALAADYRWRSPPAVRRRRHRPPGRVGPRATGQIPRRT